MCLDIGNEGVFCGFRDGRIRMCDFSEPSYRLLFEDYSPVGNGFLALCYDQVKGAIICGCRNGDLVIFDKRIETHHLVLAKAHTNHLNCILLDWNLKMLFTGSDDGYIKVWSTDALFGNYPTL